jgi:hypothetical protein
LHDDADDGPAPDGSQLSVWALTTTMTMELIER